MAICYNARSDHNRQITPPKSEFHDSSSTPSSPRYEEFLDLESLDTRLRKQRPATPILSSVDSDIDSKDSIDGAREALIGWGLNETEIDRARRWDQKPLHHTSESIHMRLLAECAEAIVGEPPSLYRLYNEYDKRMKEYNRRKQLAKASQSARDRAQQAVDQLVSQLLLQGDSTQEIERYGSATGGGEAAMELVAEYCEHKLRELRRKTEQQSKRAELELARRNPRRSGRVQNRVQKTPRMTRQTKKT